MTTADEKLLEVAKTNIANTTLVKMNVRSSLLDKKMQALTGTSPSDFIKIARLNHALKLLKKPEIFGCRNQRTLWIYECRLF